MSSSKWSQNCSYKLLPNVASYLGTCRAFYVSFSAFGDFYLPVISTSSTRASRRYLWCIKIMPKGLSDLWPQVIFRRWDVRPSHFHFFFNMQHKSILFDPQLSIIELLKRFLSRFKQCDTCFLFISKHLAIIACFYFVLEFIAVKKTCNTNLML